MSIGRVSSIGTTYRNNIYTGELLFPPNRSPVTRVSKVSGVLDTPENRQPSLPSRPGNLYYSANGDTAEISDAGQRLLKRYRGENNAGSMQPDSWGKSPSILDYKPNLPSPFLDWETLINSNENPYNFYSNAPVDVPLSVAEPPVVPQTVPPTGQAPADFAPPAGTPQPTGAPPPGGTTPTGAPGFDPGSFDAKPIEPHGQCSTCESRRYVDKSDDPSVTFQTPTKLSPGMAATAVAAHENQHVNNEKGSAMREGRDIVKQSVTFTYGCCPECGKMYVAGGTTRTVSIKKHDSGGDAAQSASADDTGKAYAI